MDVPDNSTLELYVLSQEEPKMQKSLLSYQRVDYKKISINNNDVYQLVYTSDIKGEKYQTTRVYISGPDRAAVITLSAKSADYNNLKSLFDLIINSFNWQKK